MRSVKTIVTIILISLGVSAVFWTVSSSACVMLGEGSFFDEFFSPDKHHLWMRIPVVIISVPIVTLLVYLGRKSAEVKLLRGLIPICAWCKKIRDDSSYWKEVESYIIEHSDAIFSHGICLDCIKELYPEYEEENRSDTG